MANTTMRKTAVVTGATSGLGEAAAFSLAKEGYRVLVVGRDAARGAEVVRQVKAQGGDAELLLADLLSLSDVRRLAREIRARAPSLDLLVNNAGATFGPKQLTADGIERTFALNVAAPFVLTEALLAPLAAAKGRVVNVVTGVPKGAKTTLSQLAGAEAGSGMRSYVRNKLALLTLTREAERRYGSRGITFVSLHPGVIPSTRFGHEMPAFLRAMGPFVAKLLGIASTLEQAAERYRSVGAGPVEPGGFYAEGVLKEPPSQSLDAAFAGALWEHVAAVTAERAPSLSTRTSVTAAAAAL
jgi:NAD(P)-dependent dehydrogenase (short-subunit alcohol dehydrogenase family)